MTPALRTRLARARYELLKSVVASKRNTTAATRRALRAAGDELQAALEAWEAAS